MGTEVQIVSTGDFAVRFILTLLATWRVSHLLALEDGPVDIIVRIRRFLGDGPAGNLMDCFNCVSLWIAAPAAFVVSGSLSMWVLSWLALSGGACVLERLVEKPDPVDTSSLQTKGDSNVLR